MMRRMMAAVEARRAGKSVKGFTLIELIVVVVIIGILAAVAIPSFLSQRTRAFNAAVISDMRNMSTELEAFYAGNLRYPTADDFGAAIENVELSEDVTIEVMVNPTANSGNGAFILLGGHERTENRFFLDSRDGGAPTEGSPSIQSLSGFTRVGVLPETGGDTE